MSTIRRVGVVNRGDAAARFLAAAREYRVEHGSELRVVLFHTDADADSALLDLADESVGLGPATRVVDGERRHSYLDLDLLSEAIARAAVDAVWVGWGFVSEHADFAQRCAQLGVTFIGPPHEVIRRLGDKIAAKLLAEGAGVPVAPWSRGPVRDGDEARTVAAAIGTPLMIKATAGGGGRGIRRVQSMDELPRLFASAQAEARLAFGDPTVFLESVIERAWHVEVQIAADAYGAVTALGIRDCSVQRRRQKVIEETAGPWLGDELRAALADDATALARRAGYRGVGTVEFLVEPDSGRRAFMEVNPRLQVEHTVTELTTGIDLVKLQLDIAQGGSLPAFPASAQFGHAIQVRVNAEDIRDGFRPAPGQLVDLTPATGPGIRFDTGLRTGDEIPVEFDPLIAKLVVHGADRTEAIARMLRAIDETRVIVSSGSTNLALLREVVGSDDFAKHRVDTTWLDRCAEGLVARATRDADAALVLSAIQTACRRRVADQGRFTATALRGRPEVGARLTGEEVSPRIGGIAHSFVVRRISETRFELDGPDGPIDAELTGTPSNSCRLRIGDMRWSGSRVSEDGRQVDLNGATYAFSSDEAGDVRAAAPAVVVSVAVRTGQRVESGDVLVVLESMKLESTVRAPFAGIVSEVHAPLNKQVAAGALLVRLDDVEGTAAPAVSVPTSRLVGDRSVRTAIDAVLDALRGYDALVASRSHWDGADDAARARLEEQVAAVKLFTAVSGMSCSRREVTDHGRLRSPDQLLRAYLSAPERGKASLPSEFVRDLEATLAQLGVTDTEPSPALSDGLYRLWRAQLAIPEVEGEVLGILRDWARRADAVRPGLDAGWSRLFEQLIAATAEDSPALADQARVTANALFGTASHAAVGGSTEPEDAEAREARLELWRWDAFELDALHDDGEISTYLAVARTRASDRRLIAFSRVTRLDAVYDDDGTVIGLPQLEAVLTRAAGMLRAALTDFPRRERPRFNRIIVKVDPEWSVPDEALRHVVHRLVPATQDLSLQKILLRVRVSRTDGTEFEELIQLREPAAFGVAVGRTAVSDERVRTIDARRESALRLRARGLYHPDDIIDMLTVPRSADSEFPAASFEELHLAADGDTLVTHGGQAEDAGVVTGLITSYTAEQPEGLRRVMILSNPAHGMGALGEPECRRIVAGLNMAQAIGIPVEWFAVSAGALIAMDSGTENLDWTAAVMRRIIDFTADGGEINIVATGINVGAQSYFDAEATMLMHTRGVLIMVSGSSLVLTGKEALEASGGVGAEDNEGIGGYARIMGPNGQAHYFAADLPEACDLLYRHYAYTYVVPGERHPRRRPTADSLQRDIGLSPHDGDDPTLMTVGDVFSATNADRKRPFDIRSVMRAVTDQDTTPLERWPDHNGAEAVIVWDTQVGGYPLTLIGTESHNLARLGPVPPDGPEQWTAGTLFPRGSKKLARALNAASGSRPVVVLGNLAGFDGSPESLRTLQLEYGAEIARAVARFRGPLVFVVVSRYHGGAFVVFSKSLNPAMTVLALEGSFASVIGGSAAASVVFSREVNARAEEDSRLTGIVDPLVREQARVAVRADHVSAVAREFDSIHTVERASAVGSVDEILPARRLRPRIIELLDAAREL